MITDPLHKHLPPMLRGTFAFKQSGASAPPPINILDTLLQAYQGQADTAGPYNTLSSIFQPAAGQTGLTDQQQQMFGYNVGPGGGIGSPATPPGGFVGGPAPAQSQSQSSGIGGKGSSPYGASDISALLGGGAPAAPAPPAQAPSTSLGGTYGPVQGPAAPASSPYGPPHAVTGGNAVAPVASSISPNIPIYSPAAGTPIGQGNKFMDPYSGVQGPGMTPGYHPGTLSLNTTALGTYGPAGTAGILQANPYLADALNMGDVNAFGAANLAANAGPSPILQTLNQQALNQLGTGGAPTQQQLHDASQGLLANFGAANTSYGPQSMAADLLGRNSYEYQRQLQNQAFASGVQGLNTQQQQTQGSLYGNAGGLTSQLAGQATGGITNPLFQLLGLGSLNSTSSPSTAIANQNSTNNPFLNLGADITGANFNQANAQSIASGNQAAAQNAGYAQLIGQVLGSDERIKKKIKKVGESPSGIEEVEWEYKTDDQKRRYHGTTAQAVEKINPYAVVTDPVSGLKSVNYGAIDVPFYQLKNPYLAKAA